MGSVGALSDDDELNINPPAPCQSMHQGGREGVTSQLFSAGRDALRRLCYKTVLFQIFLMVPLKKGPNGATLHASRVQTPLLFCGLGRCTKAGARAWHSHFFVPEETRSGVSRRQNGPFPAFFSSAALKKMTKRCETSRIARTDTTSFS